MGGGYGDVHHATRQKRVGLDDEGPTIARMHAFIAENGYEEADKHHEIYLSDPRRTAPEKLKTVLRQPVRRLDEL